MLESLKSCELCPRRCRVNRLKDEKGFCRIGRHARLSSFNLHFGEEKELVGQGGSGTIFFSFCNLGCLYCQNYKISHLGEGEEADAEGLASIMLKLKSLGAHNINFVTPTHVLPQIIEAVIIAKDKGFDLPLVYNSGGYELAEVLKKVEGIFDIYMPDIKYSDNAIAKKYSKAPDYWEVVQLALIEMHRQVGDLKIKDGIAQRGLLVRHLVLPNNLAGSFKVIDFVAGRLSRSTYLNIMDQYRPCYRAGEYPELSRRITRKEYEKVIDYACQQGLTRGFNGKDII